MEHAVKRLVVQRGALREQRAGARLDARVGGEIRRRRELIGDDDALDALARERAALKQRACEPGADEAGASSDQ